MVLFNYSTKEITAKIVYYGPGLCGKTTNLQFIYDNLPGTINKGKMLSLATKTDRTLFFDFLPIDLGTIRGMRTRLQLYTVPGQVFYNTTRKLVLKGADGVVFVTDSQKRMIDANIESFKNLEENLAEHDIKLAEMPVIVQFNKRDLPDVAAIEDLNSAVNKYNAPIYEAIATTGIGVHETLKAITRLVLNSLKEKYADKREQHAEPSPRVIAAAAAVGKTATAPQPARTPAAPQPLKTQQAPTKPTTPIATAVSRPPAVKPHADASGPAFELPELAEHEGKETVGLSDFTFEEDDIAPSPPRTERPQILAERRPAPLPEPELQADDEPMLELVEDTELTFDTGEGPLLEQVEGEAPLERFEEPLISAPSPLDATEEVFRAGEPILSDETAQEEAIRPIPVETAQRPEPGTSSTGQFEDAPLGDVGDILMENHHDDPLDLGSLLPQDESRDATSGPPGLFEEDRLNLPFEDAPSVPMAVETPPAGLKTLTREAAAAGISGVDALPAGAREISLPINLEIGGKRIRFQLKVSLDLTSRPMIESVEEQQEEGART